MDFPDITVVTRIILGREVKQNLVGIVARADVGIHEVAVLYQRLVGRGRTVEHPLR